MIFKNCYLQRNRNEIISLYCGGRIRYSRTCISRDRINRVPLNFSYGMGYSYLGLRIPAQEYDTAGVWEYIMYIYRDLKRLTVTRFQALITADLWLRKLI